MWTAILGCTKTAAGSVVAAVLCSVWSQRTSSRRSELCSEVLCWLLLPLFFAAERRAGGSADVVTSPVLNKPGSRLAPSISLWIVAICIVTACVYKAEIGTITLLPILIPLLLIAETYFRSESQASRTPDHWLLAPLSNTVWGTFSIALALTFTPLEWNLLACALSILPTAALLLVYVAFIPRATKDAFHLPRIDLQQAIVPLSYRVVVLLIFGLGLQTALFGVPKNIVVSSLLSGSAKASSWYFMIRTTQHSSWSIAPRIASFSVLATRDPFIESSDIQPSLNGIASILALSQIIYFLPYQTKYRSALWALALVAILPYSANIVATRSAQSLAQLSFDNSQKHPVEGLVKYAKADFAKLIDRQSKSYKAAHDKYRKRYGIEPPPGFEAWYDFAVKHQSPIIDDFDIIFDAVSPLLKLSGTDVIKVMSDVRNNPNSEVWHCVFTSKQGGTSCTHPYRGNDRHIGLLFNNLLGDLREVLPDLEFLVNHLDEPRVVVPPLSLRGDKTKVKVTDMSKRPTWGAITRSCESQESKRASNYKHAVELFYLPFVTDSFSAMNLCEHPEYSSMHGLFTAPTSFNLVEGFVPILSTGSPSAMGDLLFPSPAYNESGFLYDEVHDTEWHKKKNKLYWAGSTTGGFASGGNWQQFQRQRFVALAQNLDAKQHYYLQAIDGVVSRIKSSFLNGRLFDVAFTKIFQCDRRSCRDQRTYFRTKSWADKDEALRSRLVFDIDGNGISGRYYKLLASKSVPLKQTIFREWHDDRLMPWVHYIPVSQSMEELPELILYLTSTKTGQQRAKEVAEQGREWFSKAFRDVDLTIYTYRLLLELARLQDPNREAS